MIARLRLSIVLVLMLALCACKQKPPKWPYEKEPDPRTTEYVIGIPDVLAITVWKNGELNTEGAVRPDGTITMPLIGDIKADGLTPTQLKEEIKRKLSAFIREEDAIVTVAVAQVNSYYVTVAGNVGKPGRINAQNYLSVADAIAAAGGPNRFASPSDTIILRRNPDGTVRKIPINYDQISKGLFLRQNLVLLRGDRVFVP